MNRNVAARLPSLPGLHFPFVESNGPENYANWSRLESARPESDATWRRRDKCRFELNSDYYSGGGGFFPDYDAGGQEETT